jgi:hypothetical protein
MVACARFHAYKEIAMNRLSLILASLLLIAAGIAAAAEPPSKAPAKLTDAFPQVTATTCALPPKTTQYSFWQSCNDVSMNGCTLQASCRMANGNWRKATFDMSKFGQCYSDPFGGRNLVNSNGTLCCGYAGTPQICGT